MTGTGFHIKINNDVYLFPTAERAPPEGYFYNGYEAYVFYLFFQECCYLSTL